MARQKAIFATMMIGLLATVPACLPSAAQETPGPTIVGEMELPPFRLDAAGVKVDGKQAVAGGTVVVRVLARRYSSGSVYYEVKSVLPIHPEDFAIHIGRTESLDPKDLPPPESARTRLHEAHRRTVKEYDLVQVHLTLEIERTDASGRELPPKLVATCSTELWGTERIFVGERQLLSEPLRWGDVAERLESTRRIDATSDGPTEAGVTAPAEWLMAEKGEPKGPHPVRRGVGHRTVIMARRPGG